MAKNDELDRLLRNKNLKQSDWDGYAEILEIELEPRGKSRVEQVNKEFRHNYGHSFINPFREWYEPDYEEIVRATAEKLEIKILDHHSVEDLEDKIVLDVIETTKAAIIKKEGKAAWDQIEKQLETDIKKLVESGEVPPGAMESLRKVRAGGMMATLLAGRLAGFALYMVVNQLFFTIARQLGLRIGVAVAGVVIGRSLALVLGPAGWILSAIWLGFDLGNTNWKRVIPAVVLTATLRRRVEA